MDLYFSDVFEVTKESLDDYGAFNISLITDLPLFIDPFLLFCSQKDEYKRLHNSIVDYLGFLRDKSASQRIPDGLLHSWFYFPEVKQNWLGFTLKGNEGRGLGEVFARALNNNLPRISPSFGKEHSITRGTHLEKLCLISRGVGRDTISDFTTNLTKEYLLEYTQAFAERHISANHTERVTVNGVRFDYATERWMSHTYTLPFYRNDYVILTPKDILTKDDTWINRTDYLNGFPGIAMAVPDEQLREQLNNYLNQVLTERLRKRDYDAAITRITIEHPELIDYYIRDREDREEEAVATSSERVADSKQLYVERFGTLVQYLSDNTLFYTVKGNTATEARQRIEYLKDIIENKGGWKAFYADNQPIRREEDLHVFYRLTWFGTPSDVSHEVNDGRGPADFKVSRGSRDKTIVEFKLASNTHLQRNLENQVEAYQRASDADVGYKVVFCFTDAELKKVQRIVEELGLSQNHNIVLIDARKKISASQVI